MRFTRRLHPEAAEELVEAIRHYEERAGAGEDFASKARAAALDIIDSPDAWPPAPYWAGPPTVRRRKIGVYPYRVVYYRRGSEVVIIAYAHEKRRPGYWRSRISD